ncbi:MAG: hypothetical protein H0W62_02925 [Chitinophagales bacterium]|nr:hypothetical protein [Chitinophagales bacterium]
MKDRIQIGGGLGLSFGDIISIEIAPAIGYRVTPKLTTGVGFRYSYYKDNYFKYSTNLYGGQVFGRYLVFQGLFLEGDFEANNFEVVKVTDPLTGIYTIERDWIPSLLLGGGYSQQVGNGRSVFFISILYDVLQDQYSPYYRVPVIRAGFAIGL